MDLTRLVQGVGAQGKLRQGVAQPVLLAGEAPVGPSGEPAEPVAGG